MKMRMIAALMVLGLAAGTTTYAQESNKSPERPTTEQMAKRRAERMTEKLGLNEQQAREVYALIFTQIKEAEAKRGEMQKSRQGQAAKLQAILTPEQMTRWEQMRRERHDGMRGKAGMYGKMAKGHGNKEAGKGCCDKGGKKEAGKACCDKGGKKGAGKACCDKGGNKEAGKGCCDKGGKKVCSSKKSK